MASPSERLLIFSWSLPDVFLDHFFGINIMTTHALKPLSIALSWLRQTE